LEVKQFQTILSLIDNELKNANNKFPQFQSRHESFGVMLEEFQEADKEIKDIKTGIIQDYWKLCRESKNIPLGDNEAKNLLKHLEADVVNAISELIQVGAMVQKAKKLEEK